QQFALKVSTGIVNNYKIGLPSTGGIMLMINPKNGQVEAILQDNGYLTELRTAAAGQIDDDHIANNTLHNVRVIVPSTQARLQLKALQQVRDFETVFVYSKSRKRLENFKKEVEATLQVPVTIKENPQPVVEESDLLITATPATSPVVKAEWV